MSSKSFGGPRSAAPSGDALTEYDRAHFREYVRLLDAHASGMSRDEMCLSILSIDPAESPDSAYEILNSHLERAKWMSSIGYRQV